MWRNENWAAGHYIDNHTKYECTCCDKSFIIGEALLNNVLPKKTPICPYCGSFSTVKMAWTTDDMLEELTDKLGCLAIYIQCEEKESAKETKDGNIKIKL